MSGEGLGLARCGLRILRHAELQSHEHGAAGRVGELEETGSSGRSAGHCQHTLKEIVGLGSPTPIPMVSIVALSSKAKIMGSASHGLEPTKLNQINSFVIGLPHISIRVLYH